MAEMLAACNSDGGWGYGPGLQSNTEATAICGLAVRTLRPDGPALGQAAGWLEAHRLPGGAFATSEAVVLPSWASPLAGMLLAGTSGPAAAAADWLLDAAVFTLTPTPAFYGYDTGTPGWPWTAGDYSFVEPTAAAVVFLKQQGHGQHPRVRQGVTMLMNRALSTGGWNYGEPNVLDSELFPAVVPTAMALCALADEPSETTTSALDWLVAQRGSISSLFSLGWACMALNLWGRLDQVWVAEVIERWESLPPKRRTAMDTGLCLLGVAAAEGHPLAL